MKLVSSDRFGVVSVPYLFNHERYPCMVLSDEAPIRGFLSHGQSWRCHALPLSIETVLRSAGNGHALALRTGGRNEFLAPVGTEYFASIANDFYNLGTEVISNGEPQNAGGNIGWSAAQNLLSFGRRAGLPERHALDVCGAYAGQLWPALKPGGSMDADGKVWHPWTALLNYKAKAEEIARERYGKKIRWEGFGWTHGAYDDDKPDQDGTLNYAVVLKELVQAVEAENFNGDGSIVPIFIDQTAPMSRRTRSEENILRQLTFALEHSDRVHFVGPRYPYAFIDDVHHTGDANFRIGELEGYVKHLVLDLNEKWEPFYIKDVRVQGRHLIADLSTPPGFGRVEIDTDTLVEKQVQHGLRLKNPIIDREVRLENIRVDGDSIVCELGEDLEPGADYEFTYAFYGKGAVAGEGDAHRNVTRPGYSGVRGNVKRVGPTSNVFTDETVDLYLAATRHLISTQPKSRSRFSLFT
jgi:hypothetical protein